MYHLHLEHGPYRWTVKKRFHNLTLLHIRLGIHKAAALFRRGVLRRQESVVEELPKFPGRPDTMMTDPEHLEERRKLLEDYLNQVIISTNNVLKW